MLRQARLVLSLAVILAGVTLAFVPIAILAIVFGGGIGDACPHIVDAAET